MVNLVSSDVSEKSSDSSSDSPDTLAISCTVSAWLEMTPPMSRPTRISTSAGRRVAPALAATSAGRRFTGCFDVGRPTFHTEGSCDVGRPTCSPRALGCDVGKVRVGSVAVPEEGLGSGKGVEEDVRGKWVREISMKPE